MAGSIPVEILDYHRMWGQLSTSCSNLLKQPPCGTSSSSPPQPATDNGVIDPIDWLHPTPSWAALPERLVHSVNQCSLCRESTLQPSACEATTMPICGHPGYIVNFFNFWYRETKRTSLW